MGLPTFKYGQSRWEEYLLELREEISQTEEAVVNAVTDLRVSVADRLSELDWGLSLVLDELTEQTELIRNVARQLESIHRTLQSPLLTQAQELYNLGYDRLRQGLFPEALKAFLESERKNEVNFLLQFHLGKLYLYGVNKDCNLVNPDEAGKHFLLAARYAQAQQEHIEQWEEFCGKAYYHAAVANYVKGSTAKSTGDGADSEIHLGKAADWALQAKKVWPSFLESDYLLAKCLSLVGRGVSAIQALERIADLDRKYVLMARRDPDFIPIRKDVEKLAERLEKYPGPATQRAREKKSLTALAAIAASRLGAREAEPEQYEALIGLLNEQSKALERADANCEEIASRFEEVLRKFIQLGVSMLAKKIAELQKCAEVHRERIKDLRRHIAEFGGWGWGILLMFLTGGPVLRLFLPVLIRIDRSVEGNHPSIVFALLLLTLFFALAVLWRYLAKFVAWRINHSEILDAQAELGPIEEELTSARGVYEELLQGRFPLFELTVNAENHIGNLPRRLSVRPPRPPWAKDRR